MRKGKAARLARQRGGGFTERERALEILQEGPHKSLAQYRSIQASDETPRGLRKESKTQIGRTIPEFTENWEEYMSSSQSGKTL